MLVWDKNAVRDILNLFGGKIKSIVTNGGVVYAGIVEPSHDNATERNKN